MITPGQTIKPGSLADYEIVNCQLPDGAIEKMTRIACSEAGGAEVSLIQCQLLDGTSQEMTPEACAAIGGMILESPQDTSEIVMGVTENLEINAGRPSTFSTSGKLDITGMDPIGIMVFQDPSAIAAFFNKGLGLSAQEASEAVVGANKGECIKNLTKDELQSLRLIMNQAGLEV